MATVANGSSKEIESSKKTARGSLGLALESRISALESGESREFIWGCELNKETKVAAWIYGAVEEDEDDTDFLVHTLYLRHAVLGSGAAKDERNIIQVETKNFIGEDIKMPIAVLRLNQCEMCTFDLNFGHDVPVTFRLLEGNGPIHITAQHAVEWPDNEEEFLTEETVTTETEDEIPVKKGKRKASPRKGVTKRGKLDPVEEVPQEEETGEDDEEEEMEEEEEEEEEEESEEEISEEEEEESEEEEVPKKRGKSKAKGKAVAAKSKRPKSPKAKKTKGTKGKKK